MSTIKAKNIKQTVVGTTVQPLKIGGILDDGSDAKLTIGTDGSASFQGNVETSDSLKLIANYSLPSQATSFTISGLNLIKGALYKLFITTKATTSQDSFRLYVNGDTTASHYYTSRLYLTDGLTRYNTYNDNFVGVGRAGYESSSVIEFQILEDDRVSFITENPNLASTYLESIRFHGMSNVAFTNITSLTFIHNQTNGFSTPTKVKLVRVM